ncbi:MAG TPA: DUF2127 domain-containing protein [Noviherbaspirillum sp.]|nr:DUF2127 domain-containing protein [Noviherbaspirillum sp.]
MHLSKALRTIALIEAAKGALVLLAGVGLLALVHHDLQRFAENLVAHAHLNPASGYPRIFLDLAKQLTDSRLQLLASGAGLYACVRFIEAYGLWQARPWAKWFAAASGGIYIPFELFELVERVTWVGLVSLVLNIAIVAFMLYSVCHPDSERIDGQR